jgi:hypothetical protein
MGPTRAASTRWAVRGEAPSRLGARLGRRQAFDRRRVGAAVDAVSRSGAAGALGVGPGPGGRVPCASRRPPSAPRAHRPEPDRAGIRQRGRDPRAKATGSGQRSSRSPCGRMAGRGDRRLQGYAKSGRSRAGHPMGLRRPRIASDRSLSFAMAAGHAHRRRGSFRAFRASPGQRKGSRGSWSGNGETKWLGGLSSG